MLHRSVDEQVRVAIRGGVLLCAGFLTAESSGSRGRRCVVLPYPGEHAIRERSRMLFGSLSECGRQAGAGR